MRHFYRLLAETLEEDVVHRDDVLGEFPEWDSVTALAIVARIEEEYRIAVNGSDLLEIQTAGDLEDLVRSRRQAVASVSP
jgi:acyl carrier protein